MGPSVIINIIIVIVIATFAHFPSLCRLDGHCQVKGGSPSQPPSLPASGLTEPTPSTLRASGETRKRVMATEMGLRQRRVGDPEERGRQCPPRGNSPPTLVCREGASPLWLESEEQIWSCGRGQEGWRGAERREEAEASEGAVTRGGDKQIGRQGSLQEASKWLFSGRLGGGWTTYCFQAKQSTVWAWPTVGTQCVLVKWNFHACLPSLQGYEPCVLGI